MGQVASGGCVIHHSSRRILHDPGPTGASNRLHEHELLLRLQLLDVLQIPGSSVQSSMVESSPGTSGTGWRESQLGLFDLSKIWKSKPKHSK